MKIKSRLTTRQRRFAQQMADLGNQSEAAGRAGYSPPRAHVTGAELLRNRKVSEEITRCREEIEKRLGRYCRQLLRNKQGSRLSV